MRLLAGVGGPCEWWIWTPALVGHLRVPLIEGEAAQVPDEPVIADAGESGALRARTVYRS